MRVSTVSVTVLAQGWKNAAEKRSILPVLHSSFLLCYEGDIGGC